MDTVLSHVSSRIAPNIRDLIKWVAQFVFFSESHLVKVFVIGIEELRVHKRVISLLSHLHFLETSYNKLFNLLFVVGFFLVIFDQRQWKVRDIKTLKPGLKNVESRTLWQNHKQALQCFQKVLRLVVLLHHLNADMHERWRLKKLNESTDLNQFFGVELISHLAKEIIGKLILLGE